MLLLLILVRTVTNIQCVGPLKLLSAREIIRISGVLFTGVSHGRTLPVGYQKLYSKIIPTSVRFYSGPRSVLSRDSWSQWFAKMQNPYLSKYQISKVDSGNFGVEESIAEMFTPKWLLYLYKNGKTTKQPKTPKQPNIMCVSVYIYVCKGRKSH